MKPILIYAFILMLNSGKPGFKDFCREISDTEFKSIKEQGQFKGKGTGGKVYAYDCSKYSFIPGYGKNAVVKIQNNPNPENDIEEIEFMELLSRYNSLPKYLGCLYTRGEEPQVMFMIGKLDYDLSIGLDSRDQRFIDKITDTLKRLTLYYKLFRTLELLHKGNSEHNGIVNADIKPQNVMMDSENTNLVIIDFGLAGFVGREHYSGTRMYNSYYKASKKEEYQNGEHDVYALIATISEVEKGSLFKFLSTYKTVDDVQKYHKDMLEKIGQGLSNLKNIKIRSPINGCENAKCILWNAIKNSMNGTVSKASVVANNLESFLNAKGVVLNYEFENQDFKYFRDLRKEFLDNLNNKNQVQNKIYYHDKIDVQKHNDKNKLENNKPNREINNAVILNQQNKFKSITPTNHDKKKIFYPDLQKEYSVDQNKRPPAVQRHVIPNDHSYLLQEKRVEPKKYEHIRTHSSIPYSQKHNEIVTDRYLPERGTHGYQNNRYTSPAYNQVKDYGRNQDYSNYAQEAREHSSGNQFGKPNPYRDIKTSFPSIDKNYTRPLRVIQYNII